MTQEQNQNDPFDLQRFVRAQEYNYADAISELKHGQKTSHWMWYIFPQLEGLGQSYASKKFSIKTLDEARAYLRHPVLGARLKECTEAVLTIEDKTVSEIFGFPDDMKLNSSMTLFEQVAEKKPVFSNVLDKYFHGERDSRTLALLNK
jgi:uncharacterized protein (DUF1810 family)